LAIQVWTAQDLDNVRNDLSGDYIQMADIDIEDLIYGEYDDFNSIGGGGFHPNYPGDPFTGKYNGNGFKIKNFKNHWGNSLEMEYDYLGLFGIVSGSAQIINVHLQDVYLVANRRSGVLIGSIHNSVNVIVRNCSVTKSNNPLIRYTEYTPEGASHFFWGSGNSYSGAGGLIGAIGNGGPENVLIENCVVDQLYIRNSPSHNQTWQLTAGFIGYIEIESGNVIIQKCGTRVTMENFYSSTFRPSLGGFAGWSETIGVNATILFLDCFAIGELIVTGTRGGFGGFAEDQYNQGGNLDYINCYAAFISNNTSYGQGFLGYNYNEPFPVNVINCYYDVTKWDEPEWDITPKGEPRTTLEMTYPHNMNTYVDWDFEDIWRINDGINDGYPLLQSIFSFLYSPTGFLNITVVPGTLVPTFNEHIKNYTVQVSRGTKFVAVTAFTENPLDTIKVNDKLTKSNLKVYVPIQAAQTQITVEKVEEGG
jgi:hypothetical protein